MNDILLTDDVQDWLYEDGEDATKAQYVAKLEELRASAGPIIQRFNDKRQEEEDARRKVEEEKRAALLAKQQEEAEKKKALEEAKKQAEAKDAEMKDAPAEGEGDKPSEVEEA